MLRERQATRSKARPRLYRGLIGRFESPYHQEIWGPKKNRYEARLHGTRELPTPGAAEVLVGLGHLRKEKMLPE